MEDDNMQIFLPQHVYFVSSNTRFRPRQVITPDTFKGLQSLERLDLHKNRIEVIGDKTFRDLQTLKTLDLQENSLKYIAPNGFHGLQRLQRLNLQVYMCVCVSIGACASVCVLRPCHNHLFSLFSAGQ